MDIFGLGSGAGGVRRRRGLAVAIIVVLVTAVRVVPEYQRLVVLRLGRVMGVKGPGLVLLLPVMD